MASRIAIIAGGVVLLAIIVAGGGYYAYLHSESYDISVATGDGDVWTRKAALANLYNRTDPDKVAPVLIGLLKDPDSSIRSAAAEYLGWMHYRPAVEPLLAGLAKQTYDRDKFFTALGNIGDPSAVKPLLDLLDAAKDEGEARAISGALAKLGPDALPAFIARLTSEQPATRASAAAALGWYAREHYQDDKAKQALAPATRPLIALLTDPSDDVRSAAADAMGNVRDPEFLPALIAAINVRDPKVREIQSRVISYFGDAALTALKPAFQSDDLYTHIGAAAALDALNDVGVYDIMRKDEPYVSGSAALLNDALARQDLAAAAGAYDFYIRQGDLKAVPVLAASLKASGDKRMAETLLNCGHPELEEAAKAWAETNGYKVGTTTLPRGGAKWGKSS